MKEILAVLFLVIGISSNGYAADHYSVVTSVGAYNAQWGVFNIKSSIPSENSLPPSCDTRRGTVSFDKSTPHGKDMLSIILTAFATGDKLYIQHYTSACGADGIYSLANRVDVMKD